MNLHEFLRNLEQKNMKRIHFISGIIITVFIGLHLFNHLYSLAGVEEYTQLMNKFRVIYRNPIAETLLICAVLVQIVTGMHLFLRKRKVAIHFFEKLQVWSGFYLALFFVFHLGAVFAGRIVLDLDTNFYFGVSGLNTFPLNLFFIPYYGLAIISFFSHIAAVHAQKMKQNFIGIPPKKQAYFIVIVGLAVTLIIFYGLTNGFKGIEIPVVYRITT